MGRVNHRELSTGWEALVIDFQEKNLGKKKAKKKNHRKYLDVFVPAFSRYAI